MNIILHFLDTEYHYLLLVRT